jgi:IS30 family transposase
MSHITDEQRCTIQRMKEAGYQQKQIAVAIGKSDSSVSRELRRNRDERNAAYRADLAARKSAKRKKAKPKAVRFTATMRLYVEERLALKYSPEQIVGVARQEGLDLVSHERIYQHIWQDKKHGGGLHEHLRTRGKRYRKRGAAKDRRGIIVGRVDIDKRPAVVEERKRFGDLEMDTIIGRKHKGAIVTINDRASGMLLMRKVPRKESGPCGRGGHQRAAYMEAPSAHSHKRQREGVRRSPTHRPVAQAGLLLRQTIPQLGARFQREPQWSDPPVHPQAN